jgi:hypothetical protein
VTAPHVMSPSRGRRANSCARCASARCVQGRAQVPKGGARPLGLASEHIEPLLPHVFISATPDRCGAPVPLPFGGPSKVVSRSPWAGRWPGASSQQNCALPSPASAALPVSPVNINLQAPCTPPSCPGRTRPCSPACPVTHRFFPSAFCPCPMDGARSIYLRHWNNCFCACSPVCSAWTTRWSRRAARSLGRCL